MYFSWEQIRKRARAKNTLSPISVNAYQTLKILIGRLHLRAFNVTTEVLFRVIAFFCAAWCVASMRHPLPVNPVFNHAF